MKQFNIIVTKNKEKFKVSDYKRFHFLAAHKYTYSQCIDKHACDVLKNGVSHSESKCETNIANKALLDTRMVPVKKPKLHDCKSFFKYIGRSAFEYISSILVKLGAGDD